MSTNSDENAVVFEKLVEADAGNAGYGTALSEVKRPEKVSTINAPGNLQERTPQKIILRAERLATAACS